MPFGLTRAPAADSLRAAHGTTEAESSQDETLSQQRLQGIECFLSTGLDLAANFVKRPPAGNQSRQDLVQDFLNDFRRSRTFPQYSLDCLLRLRTAQAHKSAYDALAQHRR